LAGLVVLGVAAVRELPEPYPRTAKRTLVAAWLVAAAGFAWWVVAPGAGALVLTVVGFGFLVATLNREPERPSYPRATPYQPPR
jgi:ABC-type dipeptide/oligopeptide/nickel transport system permease subunit